MEPQTLSVIAIGISAVSLFIAILSLAFGRSDARRKARDEQFAKRPGVKATINRAPSIDGWRSDQLHITRPPGEPDYRFGNSGWRIASARLIAPWSADLAFARDDDPSLLGPVISTSAERTLSRRPSDHLQPFAMEF